MTAPCTIDDLEAKSAARRKAESEAILHRMRQSQHRLAYDEDGEPYYRRVCFFPEPCNCRDCR